jgi:glycolate oxidase iron-sulfur subunit
LLQPELADAVLARRLDDLRAARPDIVVVANPGCQLQLLAGVREAGLPIEVLHMAEWLARVEHLENGKGAVEQQDGQPRGRRVD